MMIATTITKVMSYVRGFVVATSIVIGVLSSVSRTQAQVDDATLRARLAALEKELDDVRSRRVDERTRLDARVTEARTRRDELAQETVQLELDRQAAAEKLDALVAELGNVGPEASRTHEVLDNLRRAAVAAGERYLLHMSEIPAAESTAEELRRLATEVGDTSGRESIDAALRMLAIVDRIHREAGTVAVESTAVRTASGRVKDVELLRGGHAVFAYRTGDRVGLALASPSDASGFRWDENLDDATRDLVTSAIDAVKSGADVVDLPVDVSGRLRVDASQEEGGLFATLRSGGAIMFPLALIALVALGLIIERFWFLVRAGRGGERLAHRVLDALRNDDVTTAKNLTANGGGVVARVLDAGLERHARGQHAMEDGIQEQLLHELPRLQRFLGGIGVLGAIAPLLGLLGTVTGIIGTFGVIRTFGNADPGLMAGGISEALVTTAAGLVVAIPILLFQTMLSGRVDRVLGEAERHAASLINVVAEREEDHAERQERRQERQGRGHSS